MTSRLEEKIKVSQANLKAIMKLCKKRWKTDEEMKTKMASLTFQIDANQEEIKSTVNTFQEKMEAWIAEMKDERKETVACQVTTEARLECKEPASEGIKSEVEHEEVPKEGAAVETSRASNKRHRDQHMFCPFHKEFIQSQTTFEFIWYLSSVLITIV
jgi:hypothetical protein